MRLSRLLIALLICALMGGSALFAQDPAYSSGSSSQSQASQDQGQGQNQDQNKDQQKKEKKKKKKDKDKGADTLDTSVFNAAEANNVLGELRDGLEGHSQRLMLSAFDSDKMDGYTQFEDQIEAFFQRYEAFTVHYRVANATQEGSKGVMLVDFQMEEIPRSGKGNPVRKSSQVRFELERGKKGWKIVDFRPRDIFS